MLEENPPGGPITQSLKDKDLLQYHHHTTPEKSAVTILLDWVRVHEPHPTPHTKRVCIPGFHATPHLTLMSNFRVLHPTLHKGKDCILEYRSPRLPQWNKTLMDTRAEHYHTPRIPECPILTTWTKFGEEGFVGLRDNLGDSTFPGRFVNKKLVPTFHWGKTFML